MMWHSVVIPFQPVFRFTYAAVKALYTSPAPLGSGILGEQGFRPGLVFVLNERGHGFWFNPAGQERARLPVARKR
jgi:hypothetical protein